MPQRPRQHILEDESRIFFQQSIPKNWVVRDKSKDYGVDCEVEIFNDSGNATGLVFWVQLKATDSEAKKAIKKLSLDKDKVSQLTSYEIPILIVRYSSSEKSQYFKWARKIPISAKLNKRSYSIQFYESEYWNSQTPSEINAYLSQQLQIKRGKVSLPIKTFVGRSFHNEEAEIPLSYIYYVKQCLGNHSNYFELCGNKEDSFLQLYVSNNQVIVSLTDQAICTTGANFAELNSVHFGIFTRYLLIAFCQALFIIGKDELAHKIFFKNNLLPVVCRHKNYLEEILSFLIAGPYAQEVLDEIANSLLEDDESGIIGLTVQLLLMSERRKAGHSKDALIEDFFLKYLNIVEKKGNALSLATCLYNLGSFYRNSRRALEALPYYLRTRKFDPSYKDRHYYFFEIAGVLFECQRYVFAAKFYAKSCSYPNSNPMAMALEAHSLIYAGEYAKAVTKLDHFLTHNALEENVGKYEWHLWYSCLATLLEHGDPPYQKRNPSAADRLAEQGLFEEALNQDLLNAHAWFNRGVINANKGLMADSVVCFTLAGLTCNVDVEAWKNATMLALQFAFSDDLRGISMVESIIGTAFFYNQYTFVTQLTDACKTQNPLLLELLTQLIDVVIKNTPKEPVIIRVNKDIVTI